MILDSAASEEERNSTLDVVKKLLETANATITKEDVWGDKKLAYTINKSDRWFYVLYYIDIEPTELKHLTQELNLEKSVWRHMFVRADDNQ